MELKLGQKFEVHAPTVPALSIEITKLGTKDVEFLVSGEGIENPDTPRVMPVIALVKWLQSLKPVNQG